MSGPADTSYAERMRRLRGKAVAVGVANGNKLDKAQGGSDFDTQAALKMGQLTYTRETPAGAVTEPGCGCGTLLRCTEEGSPGVLLRFPCNPDGIYTFVAPQDGTLNAMFGYNVMFSESIGPIPLTTGETYTVSAPVPNECSIFGFRYTFDCA